MSNEHQITAAAALTAAHAKLAARTADQDADAAAALQAAIGVAPNLGITVDGGTVAYWLAAAGWEHFATLPNDDLDHALDLEAAKCGRLGVESTPKLEALLELRRQRVAARQAEIARAEAEWVAEVDAAAAEAHEVIATVIAERVGPARVISVPLTRSQAEALEACLPPCMVDAHLLETRIRGTAEELADAAAFLDADEVVRVREIMRADSGLAPSDRQEAAWNRATRRAVLELRRKLQAAARRHGVG